jgi:hypothetical protein
MADDGWQLRMWYEGTCVRCWHELNYDATPNTARPAWVGGVPGFNGWPANCESEREKLPANSKMLHSGQARYCNTVVIRCLQYALFSPCHDSYYSLTYCVDALT